MSEFSPEMKTLIAEGKVIYVNRSKEIRDQCIAEGKHEVLDKPHHLAAILEMNKHLEQVRRGYIIKNANSERGDNTIYRQPE